MKFEIAEMPEFKTIAVANSYCPHCGHTFRFILDGLVERVADEEKEYWKNRCIALEKRLHYMEEILKNK